MRASPEHSIALSEDLFGDFARHIASHGAAHALFVGDVLEYQDIALEFFIRVEQRAHIQIDRRVRIVGRLERHIDGDIGLQRTHHFTQRPANPAVTVAKQALCGATQDSVGPDPEQARGNIVDPHDIERAINGDHPVRQPAQHVFGVVAFLDHVSEQLSILERDGALRRQHLQPALIPVRERPPMAIQYLHDPDRYAMLVDHGHPQNRSGAKAGLAIDFRIEAGIAVGIQNIDRLAVGEHFPGDSHIRGDPDLARG